MLNNAANILIALRNLAFPPACAACGARLESQGPFCHACQKEVRFLTKQEPNTANALAEYGGPVGQALRGFKYNRRLAGGAALAKWLARVAPPAWLAEIDLIAPVPLHPRRLMSRGFNQALLLFAPLAHTHGIRFSPDLLARLRHTRPQIDLPPKERRNNVAGAFGVRHPKEIKGQRVLLVDDVYTTGATAHECTHALVQAGAAQVRVLTLARAVEGHDGSS
jgi:ComF family protein